jgi:hypothetical protein
MKQTIVFAAQKRCWPTVEEGANLHCEELPESPLPADLYGNETDVIMNPDDPETVDYHHVRPRFINGGVYVGMAGDLRRAFRRGFDQLDSAAESGAQLFSEQGVTGQVLGEQETYRNWRRKHSLESSIAETLIERNFEYHIGLDYTQELSLATCHSDNHGNIVPLGNQSAIDEYSSALGLTPARIWGVPDDIKKVHNPLDGYVSNPQWEDMPLYTDFFTQAVPAIVHHNAYKNNAKERRVTWWHRMWFVPHLRDMVTKQLRPGPLRPLATIETDAGDIVYWAPKSDALKRKPRLLIEKTKEPMGEASFDTLCRVPDKAGITEPYWWDEVFRDSKGPI